jgi:hypothetical protein
LQSSSSRRRQQPAAAARIAASVYAARQQQQRSVTHASCSAQRARSRRVQPAPAHAVHCAAPGARKQRCAQSGQKYVLHVSQRDDSSKQPSQERFAQPSTSQLRPSHSSKHSRQMGMPRPPLLRVQAVQVAQKRMPSSRTSLLLASNAQLRHTGELLLPRPLCSPHQQLTISRFPVAQSPQKYPAFAPQAAQWENVKAQYPRAAEM